MEASSNANTTSSENLLNRTATGTFKILCVSFEARKLGAACYEEFGQTIYYMRDTTDGEDFSTLRYLVDRLKPTHVIINSSMKCNLEDLTLTAGEKTLEISDKTMTQNGESSTQIPVFKPNVTVNSPSFQKTSEETSILRKGLFSNTRGKSITTGTQKDDESADNWFASLQMMPRSCFTVEEGKKWLKRILEFDKRNSDLRAKMLFDTGEVNMMSALGALLRHVNQLQIGMDVDQNSIVVISSFKQITPLSKLIVSFQFGGDVIDVDIGTMKALEIFECQNEFMGSKIRSKFAAGKRNSESLFDFCNMCKSTAGKRKLRAWFSRPIQTREILKFRQDGISFFIQDCNLKFTNYVRSKIRHVSMLNGIISRMRLGKCPVTDWKNLLKANKDFTTNVLTTVDALIKIGDALREYEVKLPILGPGEKSLGMDLARLNTLINETFDQEQSIKEDRFVVNAGISEELDECNYLHAFKSIYLTILVKATYDELGTYLTEVARHEIQTYNFDTCSVCYLPIIGYMVLVPTASMEDLEHTEIEMVTQKSAFDKPNMLLGLLYRASSSVGKIIFDGIEVVSTLDCLISLAIVARENDWCRPHFSEKPIVRVVNGRHPISERVCTSHYIPNPIDSADPLISQNSSKVKIITGPNASGKSVYLKMVGTLIYLAHVGSFVPAEKASFGPINRIISRMYSIDTVLNGLSSFGNDVKQMSDAICKADANSEVGLSLLASCLNYWLDNENRCPHVFVSTHFHSLPNLLHESRLVSNNLMRVTTDDDEDLHFTYEFVNGFCTHSHANFTTLKVGIKRSIIDRAEQISSILKNGKSLTDVPSANQEDERKMGELAARMETLVDDFFSWDMSSGAKGFLEEAKMVLCPDVE
ncbi:BMA-MSH-5, isoform d [Aphelenchoides bicaudatus]|nr:BMA-MSH-5, isoform d [Aphelenchoides bicaudatus]